MKYYASILDNIVFLKIEKIQNENYLNLVKIKDGIRSDYQKRISFKDRSIDLKQFKDINDFIGTLPIASWDNSEVNKLFYKYSVKNRLLSILELTAIIEPWRKEFNYHDIFYHIVNCEKYNIEINSLGADGNILFVNSLLCRLWNEEEKLQKHLYKELRVLALDGNGWGWTDFLLRPIMFSFDEYKYVNYEHKPKEKNNLSKIDIDYQRYERLLKEKSIWNNGGDFHYVYRADQEKMAEKIRKSIEQEKRIFIEAPTGSGKTFAYLLIVAIKAYLNLNSRNADDRSFIISTDTKELQNQLIEKDIPQILKKLGLDKKIKYGSMKGKGNYICAERLSKCEEFVKEEKGTLSYVFLKRLSEEGEQGDIENINYWAYEYFELDKYKNSVTCDSENCDLDKCNKKCYLKNRYNQLSLDNITVVNHSLLASWPYSEKKRISNLIIDEAHNLMEKGYDYFSDEFDANEFLKTIKELDEGTPSIIYMLNRLNALYSYKETIDKNLLKDKARDVEIHLINLLNEFKRMGLHNNEYDFSDEFFNAEPENKLLLESIKEPLSVLKASIYSLYKQIFTYLNNIVYDEKDTGAEYRVVSFYLQKLKNAFDIIDSFLSFSKEYAKTITITKEFSNFILKNTPLNIGELVNEKILAEVKSTVFISATLRINNSFDSIKSILGQEQADDFIINPVFDLKKRTKIFVTNDIGSYKNKEKYIYNSAKFIFEISKEMNGHILVLFNNNNRRELVKKELEKLIVNTELEIHTSKKAIKVLKDKKRKAILLGTKGFFEGIDLPGDALKCVVFDKIPNVNPKEPLFKAMRSYKNVYYKAYNYPKLCIKVKQGYGRLVRSVFDYGYFIVLDGGTNKETLYSIERDLEGPYFHTTSTKNIVSMVKRDMTFWQRENLRMLLRTIKRDEIKCSFNDIAKKSNQFWEYNDANQAQDEYIFNNGKLSVKVSYNEEK